jgi:lipopolysaccharide/colanic/teichoic acid biosynthesis glycosyltransferase
METKRVMDVSLVLLTAPVWVPLTAALALAVAVQDGRPVFFLQQRVGQGRQPFFIFKLRTMTNHPDVTQRQVTPLGAWLRQRGLDELPQLFNVLKGEMSLVGPRPMTQGDVDRLSAISTEFARRLEVRPGITGLPQVTQARGAHLTAALDAQYARERSVWMDLGILCRTAYINVVGKTRGARRLAA